MRILVVFILFLMIPHPAAADWLQQGADAARTGAVDAAVPDWPDVAFEAQVPAVWGFLRGDIVVIGRSAYILVPEELGPQGETSTGPKGPSRLYRIDLDNGTVSAPLAEENWPLVHLASDGEQLVGVGRNRLMTWALDGSQARRVDLGPMETRADAASPSEAPMCGPPVLRANMAFVACMESVAGGAGYVSAVNLSDLGIEWTTILRTSAENNAKQVIGSCSQPNAFPDCGDAAVAALPSDTFGTEPHMALSLVGESLFVAVTDADEFTFYTSSAVGHTSWSIYVVDLATRAATTLDGSFDAVVPATAYVVSQQPFWMPAPAGVPGSIFVKSIDLVVYHDTPPRSAGDQTPVDRRDVSEGDRGSGFAVAGDKVYATTLRGLHAFDLRGGRDPDFAPFVLPDHEAWASGPMAVARGRLVAEAAAWNTDGSTASSILHVFDAATGRQLWHAGLGGPVQFALADGAIVTVTNEGAVRVLGSTAASIVPRAHVSTHYPTTDAEVEVDLSASIAGVFGAPSAFRADWGDGTITPWQTDGRLTHRYTSHGDVNARFFLRNDANQSSSIPITFFVGRDDPAISMWNSPFHDRYQEASFFILGLLATSLLAALGVLRSGRKRRLLHRELRDLESEYQRLEADAKACDAMLNQRRARAKAMYLQRRLEEAHSSFLVGRVDELRRGLRMGAVDAQLKFLPHGMVVHLQRLLADARVDEWERNHFMDALEKQKDLSAAQRSQARKVIDEWFARDAGA